MLFLASCYVAYIVRRGVTDYIEYQLWYDYELSNLVWIMIGGEMCEAGKFKTKFKFNDATKTN